MTGKSGMNRRIVGGEYEEKAASFLRGLGYEIVEKNYYCRYGEIDIVAKDGGYFVFVEVKYRNSVKSGSPEGAVDETKMRHMRKAALDFLVKRLGTDEIPCRFDVVAFLGGRVHLIKDAF